MRGTVKHGKMEENLSMKPAVPEPNAEMHFELQ